jgi:hypothetical protein
MILPYISLEQFAGYENKWVALRSADNAILGSGTTLQEAADQARVKGYANPVFFRVPPRGYFLISTPFLAKTN